jgi:hypothetical protein
MLFRLLANRLQCAARLLLPCALLFGSAAAQNSAYVFTHFAGSLGGLGYADGPAASARFNGPAGLAYDRAGNLFVADSNNHVIRKMSPDGTVTTFAGKAGEAGTADGTVAAARLRSPGSLAIDTADNLYVGTDEEIRRITPEGVVTTLCRHSVRGMVVDSAGNLYYTLGHAVFRLDTAGHDDLIAGSSAESGSTEGFRTAARFNYPMGLALDEGGSLYVADTFNYTIRRISPDGIVSTVAGAPGQPGAGDGLGSAARFQSPSSVSLDAAGNLYVLEIGIKVRKISPAGDVSTFASEAVGGTWSSPGITVDRQGNVVVAVEPAHKILTISPTGTKRDLAGWGAQPGTADGDGTAARFSSPIHAAMDDAGTVYVSDPVNSTIRKISPTGTVTTWAGAAGVSGWVDGTVGDARFASPRGIAVDPEGNVYVADSGNYVLRKISRAGVVTTIAGRAGSAGLTDGDAATARFSFVEGIALGPNGTIYVTDSGSAVRRVSADGSVTTLAGGASWGTADGTGSAAGFMGACSLTVDADGTAYVAEWVGCTIRKVTASGVVTTFAGATFQPNMTDGTGPSARFRGPRGITLAADGNLYVGDSVAIRRVTKAGVVTTIAGSTSPGCADGAGAAAAFGEAAGIAVGPTGDIYVADTSNHAIRKGVLTVPTITWPAPAPVAAGTALSATQLNATANLPGTFTYTPAAGTVLAPGNHTLSVTFTPTDTINFGPVTASVTLTVSEQPSILTQPVSRTAAIHATSTFGVTADGVQPLQYRWEYAAAGAQEWADVPEAATVGGSRSATLALSQVAAAMSGNRYRCVVTNTAGTATSNVATLTVVRAVGMSVDLDGDGIMEPVWRSNSTQELGSWTAAGGYVRVGQEGSGYEVMGYGDFDGDGRSEAVWRHTGTRALVTWPTGGGYLPLGTESGAWQVLSLGDFDGDGKTEFLWRHGVTTEIATWTMAGAYLHLGNESTGWQVIGVGDFDGDGKTEPLWRQASTAEVGTWTMAGPFVHLGSESTDWEVLGVGDFDADGKTEPMWRNRGTREVGTWTMAGTYLALRDENSGWTVIGAGDYDGDGKTEPLWRQTSTQEVGTWTMAGAYVRLGTEANEWRVVPQTPTITSEPTATQWLRSGAGTTLSVGVTSNPAAIVQWQVSMDGSTWADVVDGAGYSGAGTTSLTISGATRAMHGSRYRCVVRNGAGRAMSAVATLNVSARACVAYDLDGDGKTDVLWRYAPLQELGIWTASGWLHLGTEGTGWVVIGVGDFDADGKMELIWRHTGSGQIATWPSGGGYVPLGTESAWQVIRIGDFDGDGRSELLWRHSGTGQVVTWTQAGAYLELGGETDGWRVIGIADFDGDGRQEPAWRNTTTFEIRTTTMAGATVRLGTEGGGWAVIAFGDVDGDGKAEPFWRHASTLENVSWPMAGGFVRLGGETGGWHVIAVGDYDGDGRSEPLWQHELTHEVATWTIAGAYLPLGTESTDWVLTRY